VKDFLKWFALKPSLDQRQEKIPSFSEREVWMCSLGTNIGYEIDGKDDECLRPIIVFKKLSHETFIALPLSTGMKQGSWYSPSDVKGRKGRYCLHQIRMLDSKRLKYRIERIDMKKFTKLQKDFDAFLRS